jgi:Vitamin B12 dependent methionine synthase, activation domain
MNQPVSSIHFSLSIDPVLLNIKENNILKSLGVPLDQAEVYLMELIKELIAHCKTICSPKTSCLVFSNPSFNILTGQMTINGKSFLLNKMVASALKSSTGIAIFIGTCGDEVEKYSKKLINKGDTLEGFIVDLIGSEIAEWVAEYTHDLIEKKLLPSGMRTTNRYSPGYCNWPVSDQHQIFSLMENNNCGVSLNASSLMIPIKSVSGIIGLGKNVENKGYACSLCEADHCLYRDK